MGCDFVRVHVDEHLGNQSGSYGGTYKGFVGDTHSFKCTGIDTGRDVFYLVYGVGMHSLHFFRLNGKGKWWIEPSVDPSSPHRQLRIGFLPKGVLQANNKLQVFSNPDATWDDYRIFDFVFVYPTKA